MLLFFGFLYPRFMTKSFVILGTSVTLFSPCKKEFILRFIERNKKGNAYVAVSTIAMFNK